MEYSFRKKYSSLLLSSIIHGLLLMYLFYTRLSLEHEYLTPLRHNPAQISIQLPSSGPAQNQQKQQPTAAPSTASTQQTPRQPQPNAQVAQRTSSNEQTVSPTAFMQAFHAAVRAEREGTYASEGSDSSTLPVHVQERLKQWSEVSYKTRIAQAFLAADRRISRSIDSYQSLRKIVQLTLTILKNGSVGQISYQRRSGVPEIDRYVKDLLESIEFAPIPDRYNTNTYVFPLTIEVNLREGSNKLRLYLS